MAEEHHQARKYGVEKDKLKITAAVWPYFEEDGAIRWRGVATYGEVVLLEVTKGITDVSTRQLLASKIGEAADNVHELATSVRNDIRRA